jgi:hypothetical protein
LDKYWTTKCRFECNRWFLLNWFGAWLIIYHVLLETGFFFFVLQHACILNLEGFFCVCALLISMWFCNLSCTLVAILKIFFRTL